MEGEGLTDSFNNFVDSVVKFGKKVFNPNGAYPPNVANIKNSRGDQIITALTLRRNPVSNVITQLMNFISLGSFYKKLARLPYDNLYHLSLLVKTNEGSFVLEKIERVNATTTISSPEGLELLPINNIPAKLTVRQLIENTEKFMSSKYLPYNPSTNNCQDFVMGILKANNLLTPQLQEWVKQNTTSLFKNNPFLLNVSNSAINIGKVGNVISQGGNLSSQHYNMKDFQYKIPQAEYQHRLQLMGSGHHEIPEALQAGMGIGQEIKRFGRRVGKTYHNIVNIPNQIDNAIPTSKTVGHQAVSALLRKGVPGVVGGLTSLGVATATGNPLMAIPAGVGASYGTSRVMSKVAKSKGYGIRRFEKGSEQAKEWGKRMRALRGKGLMAGRGKNLIDQRFSIRDVAHQANLIPDTIKELKGAGIRLPIGADPRSRTPRSVKETEPSTPIPIGGGLKKRFVKGSEEARQHMAKIRAMRKTK